MTLPLGRMRVVDLTQVMAGPFCTMILADLGADVIKVEPPGTGDQTRRAFGQTLKGQDSAAFLAVNRNKRSLTLNLKSAEGQQVFRALVERADVVVENFRPGVARRLAVDYDTVRAVNPQVVYASISGFGQTGPYADRPGYDLIAQAAAGVMSVTGEPGGSPVKAGIPIADLSAGLFCATAVLSAHIARAETGQGQYLDTSLFEAALALSVWETAEHWATGAVPQPLGSAHRLLAPYQALRTADGHLVLGGNNDRLWARLCAVLGRDELTADPRFATNDDRILHRDELTAELERTLIQQPTDHWVEELLAAGVPAGPLRTYPQVLADEHTHARGMVQHVTHPVEGTVPTLGTPVKLSQTPATIRRAAPLLGEHTDEILTELGLDPPRIQELHTHQVV